VTKARLALQNLYEYDDEYDGNAYTPGDGEYKRLTHKYLDLKIAQHTKLMKQHPKGSRDHEDHKKWMQGYKSYKAGKPANEK